MAPIPVIFNVEYGSLSLATDTMVGTISAPITPTMKAMTTSVTATQILTPATSNNNDNNILNTPITPNPNDEANKISGIQSLLSSVLSCRTTAGWIYSNISSNDLVSLVTKILGKYSGVQKAYGESRKIKEEFKFPKWKGVMDMDSVEEDEIDYDVKVELDDESTLASSLSETEGESGTRLPHEPYLTTEERTNILTEAWYDTKLQLLKSKTELTLKLFAKNVINQTKAAAKKTDQKKSVIISGFAEGGTYEINQEVIDRKVFGKKRKIPKVGLSKKCNRVRIYRKGKRQIGVKTPRNKLGFFAHEDDNQNGDKSSPQKTEAVDPASAGEVVDPSHTLETITSSMEPFVMKSRPSCEEQTTTSFGLNKKNVSHLRFLRVAHKKSKTTELAHGGMRRATWAEEIKAMDNVQIHKELGMADEGAGEVKDKFANASKFAKRFLMKKEKLDADGADESGGEKTANFLGKVLAFENDKNKDASNRPKTTKNDESRKVSIAQLVIAASAKKKGKITLREVLKEARETPKDLLQYDLIEIKPAEANTSKSNHLMRAGKLSPNKLKMPSHQHDTTQQHRTQSTATQKLQAGEGILQQSNCCR